MLETGAFYLKSGSQKEEKKRIRQAGVVTGVGMIASGSCRLYSQSHVFGYKGGNPL